VNNSEILSHIRYWRFGDMGYEIEGYTTSGIWISLYRGGEIIDGFQDLKIHKIPQV